MSEQVEKQTQTVTQEAAGDLLGQILEKGMKPKNEIQSARAKDIISEFVSQVMEGQLVMSKDMETTINARIAAIDKVISAQLNEVMHHEDFQKLEGSWRGLHHLVFESETGTQLKVKVMNVNKKELLKDLEKAPEFDQSALFKKSLRRRIRHLRRLALCRLGW